MLENVHIYKFAHTDIYKKVANNQQPIEKSDGALFPELGVFLIPTGQPRFGNWQKYRFQDKLPAQRMHLDPSKPKRNQRTHLLLQATRGAFIWLPSYDPSWFDKDEDFAYFLGYYYNSIQTFYGKSAIFCDFLLKGNVPPTYANGIDDATFKF